MSTRSIAPRLRSAPPRHRLDPVVRLRAAPVVRRPLLAMGAVILALHVLGWGGLLIAVSTGPEHRLADGLGLGIGVTAYVLGVRHAFDADHIAAIDNVTRSLSSDRRRSVTVGFWFSLGHSTVVIALAVVLALGLHQALQALTAQGTWEHDLAGTLGGAVSGVFLLAVGAANGVALVRIVRSRGGGVPGGPVGLIGRLLRRPLRSVARPSGMYPIGLLFGLGFDTAAEVGLLVVAAGSAGSGFPWYAVLALPALFAAGMVSFDTLDGAFMAVAYGWSLSDPARTRRYSITVTSASVILAGVVGLAQLVSVLPSRSGWWAPVQDRLDRIDPTLVGVAVVGLFVVAFGAAIVRSRGSRATRAVPVGPGGPRRRRATPR